ncbi:tubby C-terminal domain-like protein [Bacillus sp. AK128]
MQYTYPTTMLGSSTKPLEIKVGTTKIGAIQAYYKNIFVKIVDNIGSSPPLLLRYRIHDHNGIERVHAKLSGFIKNKRELQYIDQHQTVHQVVMEDTKHFDGFGEKGVIVTFKGSEYRISRNFLKAAELHLGEELIADWRIEVSDKRVLVNIYDKKHIEHEFLIIGLFHTWFYATKG